MAQTPTAYVQARIDGCIRHCLLDSGADVSLIPIPSQFVSREKLVPDERRLLAANNTTIHIDGQTRLTVLINKQRFSAVLLVSPNVDEVILGRDWLQENNVVWNFGENSIKINGHPCHLITKNRHCPP